jgi:phosphoribosylaminoimidazole (AIR) synthetase
LSGGKMTWGHTQTGDTAVAIDKYGLKVNGSSVTRNATMLQALKSSTDFESLKAKLVELLEEETASYEVEEEAC